MKEALIFAEIIFLASFGLLFLAGEIDLLGQPISPSKEAQQQEITKQQQERDIANRRALVKSCDELGGVFSSKGWFDYCLTQDSRTFEVFSGIENSTFEETPWSKQCAQYADYKRIDLPVKCEKYPY